MYLSNTHIKSYNNEWSITIGQRDEKGTRSFGQIFCNAEIKWMVFQVRVIIRQNTKCALSAFYALYYLRSRPAITLSVFERSPIMFLTGKGNFRTNVGMAII